MTTATVVKRISKEGKKESLDKWDNAVLRTESGEDFHKHFTCVLTGFLELDVISSDNCGYCKEYKGCKECPLFLNKICSKDESETLFWQYVNEMGKYVYQKKVDRQKAIDLSRQIRDFIKNDPAEGE